MIGLFHFERSNRRFPVEPGGIKVLRVTKASRSRVLPAIEAPRDIGVERKEVRTANEPQENLCSSVGWTSKFVHVFRTDQEIHPTTKQADYSVTASKARKRRVVRRPKSDHERGNRTFVNVSLLGTAIAVLNHMRGSDEEKVDAVVRDGRHQAGSSTVPRWSTREAVRLRAALNRIVERQVHSRSHVNHRAGEATDPVCGEPVAKTSTVHEYEYQGRRYFFCSARCLFEFSGDPARYMSTSTQARHG